MSLAVIGIAGTVVSAGAAAYGAYSQNQARKKAAQQTAEAGKGINFGEKPKAAEYVPVDFTREQMNTIHGNLSNTHDIGRLLSQSGNVLSAADLARAKKLIPNFMENMRLEGQASHDLLNGQLPYDDALGIVADGNSFRSALGVPGGSQPATLRDLGLSRIGAIEKGGGFMKDMVGMAETVSPIGRYSIPRDFFLKPEDRIKLAMEQNQLIQTSDQNRNNIEAGLSPTDQANAQLALQGRLAGVGLQDSGSLAVQSLLSALGSSASSYAMRGIGGGGGYSMAADPQLYSGGGGTYYTRGIGAGEAPSNLSYRNPSVPSSFYSIPAT